MSLLVLAYPELTPSDREWVESIRTQHDPRHAAVPTHVTLVYPVDGMPVEVFVADVSREEQAVRTVARLALG